jgi:hypothetical protein
LQQALYRWVKPLSTRTKYPCRYDRVSGMQAIGKILPQFVLYSSFCQIQKNWHRIRKLMKQRLDMEKPFEIIFDFPLATSDLIVSLRATAELHHSEPYFVVNDFHASNAEPDSEHPSSLPRQEIKRIKNKKGYIWVHRDSEKETLLSMAIGKAIDEKTAGAR